MCIGYSDSGTTPDYHFFNGVIYGIKVWSRTLSAGEVQAIFTLGVPPSTNGLYNAVMLDEVSGSVIQDSRTGLTGTNLTALQSSDTPPMSQADLSFTNSTPIASYYIDLSHYNDFKTPVLSMQSNYCFRATGRGGVGPLDRGDAMADAAFYPVFTPDSKMGGSEQHMDLGWTHAFQSDTRCVQSDSRILLLFPGKQHI